MTEKSNIGLIGLAVMGANFGRNLANNDFKVSVFNRTFSRTQEFLLNSYPNIQGFEHIQDFIESLERPRKIILLVKSGNPVDEFINLIKPYLEKGDIILDLGNSYWKDTIRRQKELEIMGLEFVGCGISGGEEGALHGPSLMPGGTLEAVGHVLPFLQKAAAKDFTGLPCTTNVGLGPSGHFVKMVHNGIEYAMMQGIAEIYDILKSQNLTNVQIQQAFVDINTGENKSFLLDITCEIFKVKDSQGEGYLVDKIVDKAGAKGTGRWTVEAALEFGVAVPSISASLFARIMSARQQSFQYQRPEKIETVNVGEQNLREVLKNCLNTVFLLSYLQGLDLINQANKENNWNIDLKEVIRIWQGGCIIRSQMLKKLYDRFTTKINLSDNFTALSKATSFTIVPKPVINSCLDYILTLEAAHLPTNLIQAQRDYFGAHTYQRSDKEGIFTGGWKNLN